ncbi:MAG: BsuPI-related putative proteinase inhibitor [Firmicutes bacterium]|nr:BsuPI-related putative proteinase inhibitor [Bacillota bacterium]
MRKILMILVLVIFTGFCWFSATGKSSTKSGLIFKVTADKKSYNKGEKVNITLKITNQGEKTAFFDFSTSKKYDFWVKDESGKEVWRWSNDRVFLQVLTNMKLDAGKSRTFKEIWNQEDNEGNQLKPGRYIIYGEISLEKPLYAGSFQIEIK